MNYWTDEQLERAMIDTRKWNGDGNIKLAIDFIARHAGISSAEARREMIEKGMPGAAQVDAPRIGKRYYYKEYKKELTGKLGPLIMAKPAEVWRYIAETIHVGDRLELKGVDPFEMHDENGCALFVWNTWTVESLSKYGFLVSRIFRGRKITRFVNSVEWWMAPGEVVV